MGCDCGKPKCDGHCGVSPAVLQINNPSECVLFHRVEVPASMGDSKTNPPKNGAYKNVLLYYEADQTSWLYDSNGMPTKMVNGVTNYEDAINLPQINGVTLLGNKSLGDLGITDAIDDAVAEEKAEREAADEALGDEIDIINDELLSRAVVFDTVADMKASTDLKNGMAARTLGFHSINDGGGALYKITDTGTANEMDVIAVGSLYANIVTEDEMTPEQLGAYGDNSHNDTDSIQRCLDIADNIRFKGTYLIDGVTLRTGINLYGVNDATIKSNAEHWCLYAEESDPIKDVKIESLNFVGYGVYTGTSVGNNVNRDCGLVVKDGDNIVVSNCSFKNFGDYSIGVYGDNVYIKENVVNSDLDYSSGGALPNYSYGIIFDGTNVHVTDNKVDGYIHCIINGADSGDIYIKGNNLSSRHQHGIYLASGDNIVIDGNTINGKTNAICGVKLQCNVAEHRIHNALICNNLIKSGQSDAAQGILVISYDLSPYPIDKLIIANNKVEGSRGIQIQNVTLAEITGNTIEHYNSSGSYCIYLSCTSIANPTDYDIVISDNVLIGARGISGNYTATNNEVVNYDIGGNSIHTIKQSSIANGYAINLNSFTGKLVKIHDNMCDTETYDSGNSDGIVFNDTTINHTVLMGNYTDNYRWGCRQSGTYDASKITNVGNAFNTSTGLS